VIVISIKTRSLTLIPTSVSHSAREVLTSFAKKSKHVKDVFFQSHANDNSNAVSYGWFAEAEIAGYDNSLRPNDIERIDDTTWKDLLVNDLLKLIGSSCSIFGRQFLYSKFRRGSNANTASNALRLFVTDSVTESVLLNAANSREQLRSIDVDPTQTLFHDGFIATPNWASSLWIFPLIGLMSIVFVKLDFGVLSIWLMFAYLVANAWAQIKLHSTLQAWKKQRDAILTMLTALKNFGELDQKFPNKICSSATSLNVEAIRLIDKLRPSLIERTPMLAEYANLFFLKEYVTLSKSVSNLRSELESLRRCYEALSEIEASLCLIEHLRSCNNYCWATKATDLSIHAKGIINPLVNEAQKLTINISNGAFITGMNGVGKSTLLRSIGLNILTARAFGYCYCVEATLPFAPVFSSIQIEDSLANAESLYMAEMRRGEHLLSIGKGNKNVVFILDEIFRGTNNIESVAVTAAVVSQLAAHSMVVLSSHNLVLAPLLESHLEALRVVRDSANQLTIESGVLVETNGIDMMKNYNIPKSVFQNARLIHEWYSSYVLTPNEFPKLTN
jgi:hypothetical protein